MEVFAKEEGGEEMLDEDVEDLIIEQVVTRTCKGQIKSTSAFWSPHINATLYVQREVVNSIYSIPVSVAAEMFLVLALLSQEQCGVKRGQVQTERLRRQFVHRLTSYLQKRIPRTAR